MNKKFYAVKNLNDEIRLNSSSGGVFYSLASFIIKNGGVVYGAVYDSNFNIVHKRINKLEEICLMQGSKYSNSNIAVVFEQLKNDINNNIKVLFSGTPCQIMAAKNISNKYNYNNIIFVDIVCHGTPGKKFFDDYKKNMEKKYKSKISSINMRYKNKKEFYKNIKHINPNYNEKIGKHSMYLTFDNGKTYSLPSSLDIFYLNFDNFINRACFECKYSNMNRISDITIGDFHQFNCNLGTFNDCNGVSLVIVNSEQGYNLFNNIKTEFEYIEKKEFEIYQPALSHPAIKPSRYDEFQNDYKDNGFDFVIKKYTPINFKYKIKKIFYKVGLYDQLKKCKNKMGGEKNENKN